MHTLNFERLSVLPLARERPGAIWFYKDPPHARGWPAGLGRVRPPYRREVRPGSGEEVRAAVDYLLTDPARQDLRWERMQDSTLEEPSYLHYDIVWLSVLVQQIGLKRSYSNPFCTHIQHQWHSAAENSINTARNIGQNWYKKGYNLRKHATITKH